MNKARTFRALCSHYRIKGYIGIKLFKKISIALTNAQIRAGELSACNKYSDKKQNIVI